jgi:hypothetical protein
MRRLHDYPIEVFKIINEFDNIDVHNVFEISATIKRGRKLKLVRLKVGVTLIA